MSNQTAGEVQTPNSEGNNQVTLEALQAQLTELTTNLENERKSKERILEESKKYKEGYQTFKSKQEETQKEEARKEEERLRKEGQFQTLLEQKEQRLKELEQELDNNVKAVRARDEAITNFKKAAAFEKELGGKLKKDSYWNHVDFDKIAINPETGAIDKDSLSRVAGSFLKEYKELIDFGAAGNLPNATANGSGSLSYEQWKQLPLAERKKRMKDVKH